MGQIWIVRMSVLVLVSVVVLLVLGVGVRSAQAAS